MLKGQLTADGVTLWYEARDNDGVRVQAKGGYGGGTITVQGKTNDTAYSILNNGTAVTATDDNEWLVDARKGDQIRLSLASSTTPTLDYQISSNAITGSS